MTGKNSIALGSNSIADKDNIVSIGSNGNHKGVDGDIKILRKLVNLDDGDISSNSKEAINGSQLQKVKDTIETNTKEINAIKDTIGTNTKEINAIKDTVGANTKEINAIKDTIGTNTKEIKDINDKFTFIEPTLESVEENSADIISLIKRVDYLEKRIQSIGN
ncbi:hypothetical protein WDV76_17020 [Xenorhabdus griffiniae]|uniref:hypothetical protein n=1 Tax=Xenorhabdus griffiniae TaxID=351672 RepID=UPI0030CE1C68